MKSLGLLNGYAKFWDLLFKGLKFILGHKRLKHLGWVHGGQLASWVGSKLGRRLFVICKTYCGRVAVRLFSLDWWQFNPWHEPKVSDAIESLDFKTFVDVGANVGRYSLLASKKAELVIAVEPEVSNFSMLCLNIALANRKNLRPARVAVSDKDGMTWLNISSRTGSHKLDVAGVPVTCLRLSSLLKRFGLGHVDLVKLDVEGAELSILHDSEGIMPHVSMWIIEMHDPSKRKELEQMIANNGYAMKWLDHAGLGGHLHCYRQDEILSASR
jgi:FkbM family methyltransferase